MNWHKQGLIYVANGESDWAYSHAMIPTPTRLSENVIRVFLTFCDIEGVGRVGYVDVDADNPKKVLNISKYPILDIGQEGTFDENGVIQTSIVNLPDGRKYLYYAGFEIGTKIRYRLLSGVAVSYDNGKSFSRIKKTPILERSEKELYIRGGPFVLLDQDVFKLWYVGGSKWEIINGKSMPIYTINYLESKNGIEWGDEGKVCISPMDSNEYAFGRPYVIKEMNLYKMFYSIRKKSLGYRLGYAESLDGIKWERKDHQFDLDISTEGWDSKTVCYSSVLKYKNKFYLFYNGNDFGKTGFGYATLDCDNNAN